MKLLSTFTNLFPLWVVLASAGALVYPPAFTWFSGPFITYGLGIIMLSMGLTLKLDDFKGVVKDPKWVLTGLFLQFTIMPLLGFSLGLLFKLPTAFAVGLILVSCCPGGTASNVISFLARANVALSVTLTSISTLLAVMMTPALTTLLVGERLEVNAFGLFMSTVKVVLLPVSAGLLLNTYLPTFTNRVSKISPSVAVLAIVLIVASIIGAGKDQILDSGFNLILAVWALHISGFTLGYFASLLVTKNVKTARTVSIEVGMQNSGLGVVLARQNFSDPATAIPCAISSLTHCILGSLCATVWQKEEAKQT